MFSFVPLCNVCAICFPPFILSIKEQATVILDRKLQQSRQ